MSDLGLSLIENIFHSWKIDEKWSVQEDRGFQWWPHKLCQKIYVSEVHTENGVNIYRVYSESDIIKNIRVSSEKVEALISNQYLSSTGSSIIYDKSDCSLKLKCIGIIHEGSISWMKNIVNTMFILQIIEAEELAEYLAEKLSGEVNYTSHPATGCRKEKDEMLGIRDVFYLSHGKNPSSWSGSNELLDIVDMLNHNNCFSLGDEKGLTAEFPFGDDTSMMQIITDEKKQNIGNGINILLHLPIHQTVQKNQKLTSMLNTLESIGNSPCHFLGTWGVKMYSDTNSCPVFSLFLPNLIHQKGILTNLIFTFRSRSAWVEEILKTETNNKDIMSVIMERFKNKSVL